MLNTKCVVLDTNIVLDVFVFNDPHAVPLKQALLASINHGQLNWQATQPMRAELARVLTYPLIEPRLQFYGVLPEQVLAWFDAYAQLVPAAPFCAVRCKDKDDQIFVDLAVQQRAHLFSKDKAVLMLRKKLALHNVWVGKVVPENWLGS